MSHKRFKGHPLARFMAKVTCDGDCWLWTGSMKNGYGQFMLRPGRCVRAHKWFWEYFNGPAKDGLDLDHLCRNRACVNPEHLEPVTRSENLFRGDMDRNSHKTSCPRGHPYSGANLMVRPNGQRRCRECGRKSALERYYRLKRSTRSISSVG